MEGFRHLEIVSPKDAAPPSGPPPALTLRMQRSTAEPGPSGLGDYWEAIWHRKGTVLSAAVLSALAACLLTLPQTPVYQAQTSLEMQGLNENFLHMNEVTPNAGMYSTDGYLQTQVDVLQSRTLLRKAATKTDFMRRLRASEKQSWFSRPPEQAKDAADTSGELEMKEILKRLKVRTAPPTRIIRVTFDASDRHLAADFANALAGEFMNQALDARVSDGKNTQQWLSKQLGEVKDHLRLAEDKLQSYVRGSGLMFLGDSKGSLAEERLRQLQEELSKAEAERIARQSEYEIARSGDLESLPRVLDSVGLSDTQQKITVLRGQLAEMSHALTPEHYKVQRLKAQIDELQAALNKGRQIILRRIQDEQAQAVRREKLLEASCAEQRQVVADQAQKTVQYDLLKHDVDTYRALYDSMQQRVGEAGVASAIRTSTARVIDAAEAPALPYKPNLLLNTALGTITGLFFGLVYVCTRENYDRRVRRPGDAQMFSNTPELGVVPYSRGSANERGLVAGSMRSMLTSLVFTGAAPGGPRIIVISSAAANEGKTTIVQNLGSAIAEIAGRVLIVDCDLHRPRLDALFGVSNSWGMNNLLHDTYPVDEYPLEALGIQCANGLFVLPSGPRCDDSSDMMYSARLPQLLARLKAEFDVVIIDTPPLLELPDARMLGRLSDGVILVVRAGQTSTEAVSLCTERLREDGTVLLGTVLNGWVPKASAYGYYRRRTAGD
jgi:polysaccharide biosynthesis transport protein